MYMTFICILTFLPLILFLILVLVLLFYATFLCSLWLHQTWVTTPSLTSNIHSIYFCVRSFVHKLSHFIAKLSIPSSVSAEKQHYRKHFSELESVIEREELIVASGNGAGELFFSAGRDEEWPDETTSSGWTPLTPQLCISLSVWSAVEESGMRCFAWE